MNPIAGTQRFLRLCNVLLLLCISFGSTAHAQSPNCGFQHHFEQLDLQPSVFCYTGYEIRHVERTTISTIQVSKTQAMPDIVMPAVCMNPIPCNWQNTAIHPGVEYYTEFSASVSGSAAYKTKASLGVDLLKFLEGGAELGVEWTIGAGISFTTRTTYTQTVDIYQQDCYKVTWKFWKTRNQVTGHATEVEEYVWQRGGEWLEFVNGVWVSHQCPTDVVVTTCDGGTASGQAHKEVALEIEQIVTPCCDPLPTTPGGSPPWCCSRDCPQ